MTNADKAIQIANQCKVVAHLARSLASVHDNLAKLLSATNNEAFMELMGSETASRMETLGDMLNEMDAVTSEDAWTVPIFAAAQQLWPQQRNAI